MRDLEVAKIRCPHFHMGSPRTEMGRESRIFPYGESPFPNRVCFHLGINIYLGHPVKLKGVWANIILGDFSGATPNPTTNCIGVRVKKFLDTMDDLQ